MPQFSDDLYLGSAPTLLVGSDNINNPSGTGIGPMGRVFVWDMVPLVLQAAGLASSQNPASGASFTLTAGTGVTTVVDETGTTRYVLDVPRSVTIAAAAANTATYTVTGYDAYGQRMTQTLAAPSTSTVTTTKAFKSVISVTNANATLATNGLTVGYSNVFGIPVRVTDAAYITNVKWDATLAANAGTFVAAVQTDPATASTGDVRGTYAVAGSAPDGARRLIMVIALPALACGPNATRVGAFGVTQA